MLERATRRGSRGALKANAPLRDSGLKAARPRRLRAIVADAPFDALLLASPANVFYATGFRGLRDASRPGNRAAALVHDDGLLLVGPSQDLALAMESGTAPEDYVPHGRFFFEPAGGNSPAQAHGRVPDFVAALAEAVGRSRLDGGTLVGVDEEGLGLETRLALEVALPNLRLAPASRLLRRARSTKLPGEVELLEGAARLAEEGIEAAFRAARPGVAERELAAAAASAIVSGGGALRLLVVTSGERSALVDAPPTDRLLRPGDLLRLDVGCVVEGYYSDVARTAVVGEPDARQALGYGALLAGQEAGLAALRPGATPREVFEAAVEGVRANGLDRYRRNHCGHGIGLENYEPPLVATGEEEPLEEGMVLCVEAPYYELGRGGMMVEDMVVTTAAGCRMLTASDRTLRVIEA